MTCVSEACRHLGLALAGARVVVQGYGNVGSNAARIARAQGARVIAVSDVKGGIHDPRGLDLAKVDAWIREHRFLEGLPGADAVSNAELLELDCDILIPAAMQNQISAQNAGRIRARLLVEGANGPTSLEADIILRERGVFVVPDILANAGGVTVSYFEWVQDAQQFFWSEEEVNQRLVTIMTKAFNDVLALSLSKNVDLRTASLMRGITRITAAKRLRGVFP
jgi:glutamate dehydrogenase (NAD(P)+)